MFIWTVFFCLLCLFERLELVGMILYFSFLFFFFAEEAVGKIFFAISFSFFFFFAIFSFFCLSLFISFFCF